jgi:polar amino acid transport system permease protein
MVIPAVYGLFHDTSAMSVQELRDLARIPVSWWCILALTLTYGAYVAEVYRAGIESIHWSQVSAARSLGLSYLQTMRHVVVPQAIRRVIAPLLNDFIGLQKDTALVQVLGLVDAFNASRGIAANAFNLSAVTIVAILFVLITIPQARLVDHLVEKDAARMKAGG